MSWFVFQLAVCVSVISPINFPLKLPQFAQNNSAVTVVGVGRSDVRICNLPLHNGQLMRNPDPMFPPY
ncbi:TPA: hypothetical protein SIC70_000855 [Pasteurella multocida]|nr:hypothetical protein [Pasteurella multocida]HEH9705003.1 hypothetical protein [Pasteurella multocida]HEH9716001.1 hypothetical protein [Pasteurella multocida]